MQQNRRTWLIKIGFAIAGMGFEKLTHLHCRAGLFEYSRQYEARCFFGELKKNYLIMKNEISLIGLFSGMFEKTILTFNPGWNENAQKTEGFEDVREIQRKLKSKGIQFTLEADEKTTGPASFMITVPDGNQLLFDQHLVFN